MLTERENMLLVLEGREPEWLPDYFQACSMADYATLACRRDEKTGRMKDIFNVDFIEAPDGLIPAAGKTGRYALDDIENWKSIMPQINLSRMDWEQEAAKIKALQVREGTMINLNAAYILEEAHWAMGLENIMVSLLTEPELCSDFFQALADFWIDAVRRIYPYLKPDMVMLFDHLANQKGLLISPETYRTIIKPADKRFIEAVRDLGAYAEIHCDGLIEELLPDFAEIGVQVIQPMQVFNDINAAKEKYGFVAIGGWDAFGPGNQENATEEEIRESVRVAMDKYSVGNKYVFWESGVTPVFSRNKQVLADEARTYGRTFYHR